MSDSGSDGGSTSGDEYETDDSDEYEQDDGPSVEELIAAGVPPHMAELVATNPDLAQSIMGGGGGIGLLCGLGRTFGWKGFVGTVVLAVSPVPILAAIGVLQLEPLLEKHGLLHEVLSLLETFLVHR